MKISIDDYALADIIDKAVANGLVDFIPAGYLVQDICFVDQTGAQVFVQVDIHIDKESERKPASEAGPNAEQDLANVAENPQNVPGSEKVLTAEDL